MSTTLVMPVSLGQPLGGLLGRVVGAQAEQQPILSYDTGQTVNSVAISSDGSYIAAGCVTNEYQPILYMVSRAPLWSYTAGRSGSVESIAISADGSYIAGGGPWGSIYLFSRTSSTPLWSYPAGNSVKSISISSDGFCIVAGSWDDRVYFFSRDNSGPLWIYGTGGNVHSVAISSDGSYIAAGSGDDKVYLFSRSGNTPLWSYQTNNNVCSVAISSDGSYIAAGTFDGKVYLFSRTDNTPLWSYNVGSWVESVSISSDGNYIAAGSHEKKVYLFSRTSSTPQWSYIADANVRSVAISSDGSYIAAGTWGNKVYLFSRTSSTPQWSYTMGNSVGSVAISLDGSYVAAGSYDHKIYLFCRESTTNTLPTASFIYSPASPTTADTIQFATTPTDSDGTIASLSWDFGDGRTSALQNPTHQYSSAGTYTATLTVIDNGGGTNITTQSVVVSSFPENVSSAPTTLAISPSNFTLTSGGATTITATLTSGTAPLAGRTILWAKTAGILSTENCTTNSSGQVSVTYTALTVDTQTAVTVAASFAGDSEYHSSGAISSGALVVPVSENIPASTGGTVVVDVTELSLTVDILVVPPNALPENTTITIIQTPPENLPDYAMISPIFDIGPSGTTFTTPPTLTLPYDENEIPPGASEDDLAIYRRISTGGSWERIGGDVNKVTNTVSVQVDHLSEYAVMVSIGGGGVGGVGLPWLVIGGSITAMLIIVAIALLIRGRGGKEELRAEKGKEKPVVFLTGSSG